MPQVHSKISPYRKPVYNAKKIKLKKRDVEWQWKDSYFCSHCSLETLVFMRLYFILYRIREIKSLSVLSQFRVDFYTFNQNHGH